MDTDMNKSSFSWEASWNNTYTSTRLPTVLGGEWILGQEVKEMGRL